MCTHWARRFAGKLFTFAGSPGSSGPEYGISSYSLVKHARLSAVKRQQAIDFVPHVVVREHQAVRTESFLSFHLFHKFYLHMVGKGMNKGSHPGRRFIRNNLLNSLVQSVFERNVHIRYPPMLVGTNDIIRHRDQPLGLIQLNSLDGQYQVLPPPPVGGGGSRRLRRTLPICWWWGGGIGLRGAGRRGRTWSPFWQGDRPGGPFLKTREFQISRRACLGCLSAAECPNIVS